MPCAKPNQCERKIDEAELNPAPPGGEAGPEKAGTFPGAGSGANP
jgi:hypothetical protein